jgi:hypothetical protein
MYSLPKFMFVVGLLFHGGACHSHVSSSVQYAAAIDAEDPVQELAEMTTRYRLDSEQSHEIKPILESRAEDLNIIANDSRLSPEQRLDRLQELCRVCNREIEAVLHARQRVLFDRDQK